VQSTDFPPGKQLASFLLGEIPTPQVAPKIAIERRDGGAFVLAPGPVETDLVVLDLEQAGLFGNLGIRDALTILQRVLRFALRYWGNQKLPPSNHFIAGTSRVALFPFPISSQSSFRVVIDREPDAKRIAKRAQGRRYLLLYASGFDESVGISVNYTNFRKALTALPEVTRSLTPAVAGEATSGAIQSLTVTTLEPSLPTIIAGAVGLEAWLHLLTDTQRRFVEAPLRNPHRIEGPAGTGKTLALVLKCLYGAHLARREGEESRSLFIAHSEATRRSIQELFDGNDPLQLARKELYLSPQSITVTTLHEHCGRMLRTDIAESEFLDRDAMESKAVQLLYIDEALGEAMEQDLHSHKPFLSPKFGHFLDSEDRWTVCHLLQHEIAVLIKGRAGDDVEKYKKLTRPPQGLPLENDADRGFVFLIYLRYQMKLRDAGQFDTDDIVLSAIGQLDTPIWRRRRAQEGFDSVFVDETHLFNLNELSVFHFLTRSDTQLPIAYSVDKSQAIGDRGWTAALFENTVRGPAGTAHTTDVTGMTAVFRCSPDIVNLAFAVTSSGATLFANFEDPLQLAQSSFTLIEEQKAQSPVMRLFPNDQAMLAAAYETADQLARELEINRSSVAIISFSDDLFESLRGMAVERHKPVEIVRRWGDVEVVRRAMQANRFVLSTPDYIGGLEFDAVILVGVDEGRVPPSNAIDPDSRNFLKFAALSRLYVAITRARYRLLILGSSERGPSPLLASAIDMKALDIEQVGR